MGPYEGKYPKDIDKLIDQLVVHYGILDLIKISQGVSERIPVDVVDRILDDWDRSMGVPTLKEMMEAAKR